MAEPPQMRASHVKANVDSLSSLGPSEEREVLALAEAAVHATHEASRVAWLPLQVDVELTAAVERVVGRERMRRWSRASIVRSAEGPLLKPVVLGLQAIGFNPHNALKRGPYGWTLIYRGCGELHYEPGGEHEAVLLHTDVPAEMFASPCYVHGIAGTFEGVAELAGARDVECTIEPEPTAQRCRYRCRWR